MFHSYVVHEIGLACRVVWAKWAGERLLSCVYTHMASHILDVSSTVAARLTLVQRPAVPYPRSHLWNRKKIFKQGLIKCILSLWNVEVKFPHLYTGSNITLQHSLFINMFSNPTIVDISNMGAQITLLSRPVGTEMAHERFFPCMSSDVHYELWFTYGLVTTGRTMEILSCETFWMWSWPPTRGP